MSKTASEIINEIANSKDYQNLCKKIAGGNAIWKDLFQELIIILIEKNPLKIEQMYSMDQLKYFIIKILQNQYGSDHSALHRTHRLFAKSAIEITHEQELIPDIITRISDPYELSILEFEQAKQSFNTSNEWYENKLFKSLLKEGGLRKLERKTGISRSAITNTIRIYTEKIKEKANQKRLFMEKAFIGIQITAEVKELIHENSLYMGIDPEKLIILQLEKINRIRLSKAKYIPPPQLSLF